MSAGHERVHDGRGFRVGLAAQQRGNRDLVLVLDGAAEQRLPHARGRSRLAQRERQQVAHHAAAHLACLEQQGGDLAVLGVQHLGLLEEGHGARDVTGEQRSLALEEPRPPRPRELVDGAARTGAGHVEDPVRQGRLGTVDERDRRGDVGEVDVPSQALVEEAGAVLTGRRIAHVRGAGQQGQNLLVARVELRCLHGRAQGRTGEALRDLPRGLGDAGLQVLGAARGGHPGAVGLLDGLLACIQRALGVDPQLHHHVEEVLADGGLRQLCHQAPCCIHVRVHLDGIAAQLGCEAVGEVHRQVDRDAVPHDQFGGVADPDQSVHVAEAPQGLGLQGHEVADARVDGVLAQGFLDDRIREEALGHLHCGPMEAVAQVEARLERGALDGELVVEEQQVDLAERDHVVDAACLLEGEGESTPCRDGLAACRQAVAEEHQRLLDLAAQLLQLRTEAEPDLLQARLRRVELAEFLVPALDAGVTLGPVEVGEHGADRLAFLLGADVAAHLRGDVRQLLLVRDLAGLARQFEAAAHAGILAQEVECREARRLATTERGKQPDAREAQVRPVAVRHREQFLEVLQGPAEVVGLLVGAMADRQEPGPQFGLFVEAAAAFGEVEQSDCFLGTVGDQRRLGLLECALRTGEAQCRITDRDAEGGEGHDHEEDDAPAEHVWAQCSVSESRICAAWRTRCCG